jgi:hypothetical protein
MNIIIILILILIISNIYYTLVVKLNYLNTENFYNYIKEDIIVENNNYGDALIKYSSINKNIKSFQDLYDIQKMILNLSRYFYIDTIDLYVNNKIEIITKINENIELLKRKTNYTKIKQPVYCLIFNNFDFNNSCDEDPITVGKLMTYVKIILMYPYYINIDDNIIERNNIKNFDSLFKRGDFSGKTFIYKVNSNFKIFNHHLQ